MNPVSSASPLPEEQELMRLFPRISSQMRGMLSNVYLAGRKILPAPEELNPEKRQWLGVFNQYYFRMLRFVNNLSASAYLTGQREFQTEMCEIVSLIRVLCEQSAVLANYGDVSLTFDCPMKHHICMADPNAVRLLACQLISNAMKFTPARGSIRVKLYVRNGSLIVTVSDTGCGIIPEYFPLIFDGYLYPESGRMPRHGLGLGLALCSRIAKAHGGKILAESRSGHGSRFSLVMPDRQPEGYEGILHENLVNEPYGGFSPVMLYLADAIAPETFLYFDD